MYDTPAHLARRLVRHVPKRLARVLEPAVGKGALLLPLLHRFEKQQTRLVCVDIDTDSLTEVQTALQPRAIQADYVNEDFLDWAMEQPCSSFDCILMNPPFAGARRDCRTVQLPDLEDNHHRPTAPIPTEAAFTYVAHRLLAPGGRLLAILPCSVIMSESLGWLRSLLFRTGSIDYVYEFPAGTFRTVDSKVYLLVFRKGRRQPTQLVKPNSQQPKRLTLPRQTDVPPRLDFDYHAGDLRMRILQHHTTLRWTPLGDVARIFRGTVPSAPRPDDVVHSTHFTNGKWRPPIGQPITRTPQGRLRDTDLLIRRVGRNNHLTLGDARLVAGFYATDCLFVIRPNAGVSNPTLLFALKSILALDWLPACLERGTGARYFSKNSLERLPVPLAASTVYSGAFLRFVATSDPDASASAARCLAYHSGTNLDCLDCQSAGCPLLETHPLLQSTTSSIGSLPTHNGSHSTSLRPAGDPPSRSPTPHSSQRPEVHRTIRPKVPELS